MALPGKRNLRKAIEEHGGLIADVARHFDVTRPTVYNWLKHYDMRHEVDQARRSMREVAKDVIYQRLMSADDDAAFEAAKHVSLHLKDDGELMLSPAVLAILREQKLDPREAIRQFEAIVMASHQQMRGG